jgi:hypothetical protein
MKRPDVYKLIDGERDYQDAKWADDGGRPKSDAETPVAAWIIYIQKQVNDSAEAIYYLDENKALEHIRKIAGLAVACMEYNETKPR